jgi:hypothetical protein
MIRWPDPPPDDDETADAVRLYEQMWSIERVAELFESNYDAMRRLIARHAMRQRDGRHQRRRGMHAETSR